MLQAFENMMQTFSSLKVAAILNNTGDDSLQDIDMNFSDDSLSSQDCRDDDDVDCTAKSGFLSCLTKQPAILLQPQETKNCFWAFWDT